MQSIHILFINLFTLVLCWYTTGNCVNREKNLSYLTGIFSPFCHRSSTYHAVGDDGFIVVIFRWVALHSVDNSHIGSHQNVRHFFANIVCCPPSSHQTLGAGLRLLDFAENRKEFHFLGLLHCFVELKEEKEAGLITLTAYLLLFKTFTKLQEKHGLWRKVDSLLFK